MAIQELDLKIRHRSGRSNANADALSRSPLPAGEDACVGKTDGVLAALEPGETTDQCDLPTSQRRDEELAVIIEYLETGILPQEEGLARTLVLSSSLEDDVLYKVEQDSTLRVIPPRDQRENLFNSAHGGVFGAHLSDATTGGMGCGATSPDGLVGVWCVTLSLTLRDEQCVLL